MPSPSTPHENPHQNPQILVCYHNLSKPIIASEILRPIIVGAAKDPAATDSLQKQLESALPKSIWKSAHRATPAILRDDMGENISSRNAHFCELTAMYWAWKNLDSSYYGLFHYRRVLDLSKRGERIRTDYPIQQHYSRYTPKRYGLTTERITQLLTHYDIILPQGYKNHYPNPQDEGLDNYGIYACYHYAKDLDKAIELIRSRHPEMTQALDSVLFSKPPRWYIANVFIMRKDLYFEYCQWLFGLLFSLEREIDISSYDPFQARIYGFLAERLFNVWLEYKRQSTAPKILEAPMIVFARKKPIFGWDENPKYKRFYIFGLRVYKAKRS